jgi:hypothetical protein
MNSYNSFPWRLRVYDWRHLIYDWLIPSRRPEYRSLSRTVNCPLLFCLLSRECHCYYPLPRKTGFCVRLPSKLTSASAAIPAFTPYLPSRCLAIHYSVTVLSSHLRPGFWVISSSSFLFSYQIFVCASLLSHACNVPYPSHHPLFDDSDNIWRGVKITSAPFPNRITFYK